MGSIDPVRGPLGDNPDVEPEVLPLSLVDLTKPSAGQHWEAFLESAGKALSAVLPVLREAARVADARERDEDFSDIAKGAALDFSQRDGRKLHLLIVAIDSLPRTVGPDDHMIIATTNIDKQTRQAVVDILYHADEFLLLRNEAWINAKNLTFPHLKELRNSTPERQVLIDTALKSVEDAVNMLGDLQTRYGRFVA